MSTLSIPTIEAEMKAQAWQSVIIKRFLETDGDTTRYDYRFVLKDIRFDVANDLMSDVAFTITQGVYVVSEGEAGEAAYYDGIWLAPVYNAYLRYLTGNIYYPLFAFGAQFISDTRVRFNVTDVSGGFIDTKIYVGTLVNDELVVLWLDDPVITGVNNENIRQPGKF